MAAYTTGDEQRRGRAHGLVHFTGKGSQVALLEADKISVRFGGLQALDQASLRVLEGEIVSIIGPNGAGKTTLFNALSGVQDVDEGEIRLNGVTLDALPPHQRCRQGIGRTFQRVQLFGKLTAFENVLIGCEGKEGLGLWRSVAKTPRTARRARFLEERAQCALELVGIADVAGQFAAGLPVGLSRRVELARAIAGLPKVLLLDEPASGLDEQESRAFAELLLSLPDEIGVALLLVEHDVDLVSAISDQIYVLDFGCVIAQGAPEDVLTDPAVVEAYLGMPLADENARPLSPRRSNSEPSSA